LRLTCATLWVWWHAASMTTSWARRVRGGCALSVCFVQSS